MKESVGEENFRGILKYDITHASSLPVRKQCPFNKTQTVDRFCRKNFPYKAEWTEVDLSLCSPKTETTTKLLSLNQVGEIREVFSHRYNFFKNCLKIARKNQLETIILFQTSNLMIKNYFEYCEQW